MNTIEHVIEKIEKKIEKLSEQEKELLQEVINSLDKSNDHKKLNQYYITLNIEIDKLRLRKLFNDYINAMKQDALDKVIKDYNFKREEQIQIRIKRYLKQYGTTEEQEEYVIVRAQYIEDLNKKNQQKERKRYNESSRYIKDVERLFEDNKESTFEYFYNKIGTTNLNYIVGRYIEVMMLSDEEIKKLKDALEEYKAYCKMKQQENRKKTQEKIKEANKPKLLHDSVSLINTILSSPYTIQFFCHNKNISKKMLETTLITIKENNEELYNEYIFMLKEKEMFDSNKNAILALQMQEMIEKGIEENGEKRNFDIIDYYTMTKTDFRWFLDSAKGKLKSEIRILDLKKFTYDISQKIIKKFDSQFILDEKYKILINGEEREITQEEKMNIFKYLQENDIPLNIATYEAMEKRLINEIKKTYKKGI